jgi:hypothetical protein
VDTKFRPPPGPPHAYASPFSVTDVSPDAPYAARATNHPGRDPASLVNAIVLDQPPAPEGGTAPPPTLWAANQFAGVWRSTDGARTWHQTSNGITFGVSRRDFTVGGSYLAFDGSDPVYHQRLLYAAIDDDSRDHSLGAPSFGGLYVSSDGADSWQHVSLCPLGQSTNISTVLFSSGRPLVATFCGVFTTSDPTLRTGWTALTTFPLNPANALIATDSAGTLFACNDRGPALWESLTDGRTWTSTTAPTSGTGACRGLAADPLNGTLPGSSRTVVEISDYAPCPDKAPLPPTCDYEVSTVEFSNSSGAPDQRRTFLYPSEDGSGCCGHPYVFTALRGDRPPGLDVAGLSYDIYAADQYTFSVFSGGLSGGGTTDGGLIGSAKWTRIGNVHVDTWSGVASPTRYAPSQDLCDVWLAVDGGVFENFPNDASCTPGSGWGRAMSGLHGFGSTSIAGAPRPQSECERPSEPCPALYVSSEHNDTWATAQARAGANWGIMSMELGDSGSTFLDPRLPYQLVTGREGGGGCHLALYYSSASAQTPPLPGDQFNVAQGDRGSFKCIDPPNMGVGGQEPPGNAAFSLVRKVPSDLGGSIADYVSMSSNPDGDAIVERAFAAGSGPTIDTGWFEVNPSHHFAPNQVAAIQTSGGQAHTVIYVLTQADGNGYVKGHVYRGVENSTNDFIWTDASGSPPDNVDLGGDLFVDPYNPNNLFVTDDRTKNIKESFDGGVNWQVDSALTKIAEGQGTFAYNCVHTPDAQGITTNGCLLKDMQFVPGQPKVRVAVTLPGGVAFSRDSGHHWIDLDVTDNGTSFLSKRDPQPIKSAAGAFYDPTLNPRTGEPSIYVALRGAGVERVDGPFSHLGGIEYDVRCEACRTMSVIDHTTNTSVPMTPFPDGSFRATELMDLTGITILSFQYVVDGVPAQNQVAPLSTDELDGGVVSVAQECVSGPPWRGRPVCKPKHKHEGG